MCGSPWQASQLASRSSRSTTCCSLRCFTSETATPIRESGLFSFESLSTDLVLAALGVGLAAFWRWDPWLIPFALAPLLLIHRSLSVPQLEAEARVDAKTGLFNARHFAAALTEELGRAERFERPLSLIMADLDLLRDINNTYGHLAGDAVLQGIAEAFRIQLRHYDVPARFGGEEFAILLPETPPEQAFEIAERIRRAVAEREFDVETSSEPIRATISIGIAAFPRDGADSNELIHQADLAVYRAKLQGRNRVLDASSEPLSLPAKRGGRLIAVPEDGEHIVPLPPAVESPPARERRHPRPHAVHGPRFFSLSARLIALVGFVAFIGSAAGVLGLIFGHTTNVWGLIAIVALVGAGQALALEVDDGSISVSAVGALAGAALFDARAALALAVRPLRWSGAPAGRRCTWFSSTSARSRWHLSPPPESSRALASEAVETSSSGLLPASRQVPRTSRSTPVCSASPRQWQGTSGGGAAGRSGSPGSRRTTSSMASSRA